MTPFEPQSSTQGICFSASLEAHSDTGVLCDTSLKARTPVWLERLCEEDSALHLSSSMFRPLMEFPIPRHRRSKRTLRVPWPSVHLPTFSSLQPPSWPSPSFH